MSEFTSPAVQAMNLIRYIGDQVSESGKPIPDLDRISKKIGAPSEELAKQLIKELHEHDLIRDAKFVIADLTHDNNGAYWEAGYAEGLGKPVIYICEKETSPWRWRDLRAMMEPILTRITARLFSGLSVGITTTISVKN